MIKPSANADRPRIRPAAPHERRLDFLNKLQLPLAGGLGDFLKEEVAGEMMGGGVGLAAGYIPKKFLRKFAKETAEETFKNYEAAGMPRIGEVSADMIEKHPMIAGHLRGFGVEPAGSGAHGRYAWKNDDLIDQMVKQQGSKMLPKDFYKFVKDTQGEEGLQRLIRAQGGRIDVSPEIESGLKDRIYSVLRHELSHATDDIARPGVRGEVRSGTADDPRYWVSKPEVRARAVQKNFRRDMGQLDFNKESRGILNPEGTDIIYEGMGRYPYKDKVMQELSEGAQQGGSRIWLPPPTPPKVKPEDFQQEILDTMNHYFGRRPEYATPESVSFTMTGAPRLRPSEGWTERMLHNYLTPEQRKKFRQ